MANETETNERDTFKVRVFNDSPEWDRLESLGQRWFQMRADLLNTLHVADYVCSDDSQADRELHIAELQVEHPGCVLVY